MSYVADYDKFFEEFRKTVRFKESSDRYDVVNDLGYAGAYQFGAPALQDTGYLKSGVGSANSAMDKEDNWTGKDGVKSKADWLANKEAQDKAFEALSLMNRRRLYSAGTIKDDTPVEDVFGYIAASHLLGASTVTSKGLDGTDANNMSGKSYFDMAKSAIAKLKVVPEVQSTTEQISAVPEDYNMGQQFLHSESYTDNYFSSDIVETQDYFVDSTAKLPMPEAKASELSTITAIVNGEGLDDNTIESANNTFSNLTTLGEDPEVNKAVQSVRQDWKSTMMTFGPEALLDAEDAKGFLQSLSDTTRVIDAVEDSTLLKTQAAELLAAPLEDPQSQYAPIFEDLMHIAMTASAVEGIARAADEDIKWTVGDWLALATVSPVTERSFRVEVLDKLGIREGTSDYVLRSSHPQMVVDWLNGGKTPEEFQQRFKDFIEIVKATGDNGIYASAFLDQVVSQVSYNYNISGVDDLLDPLFMFDAYALAKGIKYLGAKVLSKFTRDVEPRVIDEAEAAAKEIAEILFPTNATVRNDQLIPVGDFKPNPVSVAVGEALPRVRTNTDSFFDQLVLKNQKLVQELLANATPENIGPLLRSLGMSPESLATRFFIGNGTEGAGIHIGTLTGAPMASGPVSEYAQITQALADQLQNVSKRSLYSEGEIARGVEREVRYIQKQSGGVLQPQMTRMLDNDENYDSFKFSAVFGPRGDNGFFTSVEEATAAMKNLFGAESARIVVRKGGTSDQPTDIANWAQTLAEHAAKPKKPRKRRTKAEIEAGVAKAPPPKPDFEFYIEADINHTVVPMDANPFGRFFGGSSTPDANWLRPYSAKIQENLFNTISAFTDRASAMAQRVLDIVKPIRLLANKDEVASMNNLLLHGDSNGMVFTRRGAQEKLGPKFNDRVWNAYKAARTYYDFMHTIRNTRTYQSLHADGFRSISVGGKTLEDSRGAVFGVPVPNVQIKALGSKILDETGELVEVTKDLVEKVASEGGIIVRTNRDVTYDGLNYSKYMIIRKTDSVVELTTQPLAKRAGHVDLMYRKQDSLLSRYLGKGHEGGTGYVLSKQRAITLNGKPSFRDEVIGIFANRIQAQNHLNELYKGMDAEELGGTGKLTIRASRETKAELGLDDTVGISGLPSHSLGRGKQVQGPNGLADVLDPLETIQAGMGEVRRILGQDVVDLQKSRFMAQWIGKMTNKRSGFPASVADLKKQLAKHPNILPQAIEQYKYVRMLDNGMSGRMNADFMNSWKLWAENLYNKGGIYNRVAGRAVKTVISPSLIQSLAKVNNLLYIIFRPLYQTLANSAQVMFLFARDPYQFGKTIGRTAAVMAGMAARKAGDDSAVMHILGRTFGMDGKTFTKYLDQIDESGITATGMSDDVFSFVLNRAAFEAGDYNARSKAFWKQGLNRAAKAATIVPQELAVKFANLTSYIHSTTLRLNAGDTVESLFTNAGRDKIAGDARKLSFTQNRADQMAYQQNPAGITLQFMHHVHKMFYQLVLSPAHESMKALAGMARGKFDLNTKVSNNIYADTKAQALMTFFMVGGMFGGRNLVGDDTALDIEQGMSDLPPELRTFVLDGVFNVGFEKMVGTKFDLASRLSPLDFPRSVMSFLFTDDGAVNLLGPTSGTIKNLFGFHETLKSYWSNPELTVKEMNEYILPEAARLFAGLKDWQRAQIAYNLGRTTTAEGRVTGEGGLAVAIMQMFSIPTLESNTFYNDNTFVKDQNEFIADVTDRALRAWMDYLRQNPEATPEEIDRTANDMYFKIIVPAIGQDNLEAQAAARDRFMNFIFIEDSSEFVQQHLYKMIRVSTNAEEAEARINRYLELHPEFKEHPVIKGYLEIRKQEQENE